MVLNQDDLPQHLSNWKKTGKGMASSELRIVLEVDSGASSPEEATVKWFEAGHSYMLLV